MASQYERDESIRRATALLNGGYEATYVYEKLLKEGFNERDAKGLIFELTGKPLLIPSQVQASSEEPQALTPAPTEPQSLQDLLQPVSSTPVAENTSEASTTSPSVSEIQASNVAKQAQRTDAVRRAAALFDGGYDDKYVQQKLIKEGFTEEEARAIVIRLSNRQTAYARSSQKTKNDYSRQGGDQSAQVMLGIVMILIGCGITFFSYQAAASNPSGGTYVVTFGLVIAGAVRVIRGLSS